MRIVSWNSQHGECRRRAAQLAAFSADIVVLQECSRPLAQDEQCVWFETIPTKGVGILATGPWSLKAPVGEPSEGPQSVYPIEVSGPSSFHLLAVWAQREPTYVRAILDGLDRSQDFIRSKPTVVVGDFNSDSALSSSTARSEHGRLLKRLAEYGLASASRIFFDRSGDVPPPTFHLYRKEDRPFHLDYCFIPESWSHRLKAVEIGSYAAWKSESDHRPILADVAEETQN